MESNEIDEIYSSISLNREPFFAYLKNLPKVICRLIVKNISVFIRLFYNQYYYIYKILNKTNSYGSDAGDIFHGFETLLKNNPANEKVILNNRDYIAIISQLLEEFKDFPNINSIAEQYEKPFDKVWNIFRLMIIPIRVNGSTIPIDDRKKILRIWLSTAFTLPLLDSYNERYIVNKRTLSALRSIFSAFGVNFSKNYEENPKFTEENFRKIESSSNAAIDLYVSPVNSSSTTQKIFRTYTYLVFLASIEIMRKTCFNLDKCKEVNPAYDGCWIHVFDDCVNSQIKKIQESIAILAPSSID